MAVLDVKVPQLSESVTEAALLAWHKKAGEEVKQDENLVDIETDKVVLELPSPGKGVLVEILKNAGAMVKGGEVIARVDTEAVAADRPVERSGDEKKRDGFSAAVSSTPASSVFDESAHPAGIVMPSAARLMAENGLDYADVEGTGKDGRILKEDVLHAMETGPDTGNRDVPVSSLQAVPYSPPSSFMPGASSGNNRPENRVPMSRLRARIAERLIQSQLTNATLTTFNEVNMQPVLDIRRKLGKEFEKEHGVRLGLMSFFMKAAVAALKKFPVVNASIDGNDIVYHGYFDIGIAISSPRGLVVPIMRDVDLMSLSDIEKKIAEFSTRAREGQLTLEDLTGGTFSISNGGVFGSMMSTPIINPPQSAILGIHATRERPVVEDGQIVIRPMNYLALSYDHRLIDGSEAVQALVTIKENLEDPARLLLDL